jgi:hypothetical protein
MSPSRTVPHSVESGLPSSFLVRGIGARLIIAAVACGLLWLAVFWALA